MCSAMRTCSVHLCSITLHEFKCFLYCSAAAAVQATGGLRHGRRRLTPAQAAGCRHLRPGASRALADVCNTPSLSMRCSASVDLMLSRIFVECMFKGTSNWLLTLKR